MAIIAPASVLLRQFGSVSLSHYKIDRQPIDSDFSFGSALLATRNADQGKNIVMQGGGGVHRRFSGPAQRYRGGNIYVLDPNLSQNFMKANETWIGNVNDIKVRPDRAILQTPPFCHPGGLEQAISLDTDIALEKPLAGSVAHLQIIQNLVERMSSNFFAIDWMVYANPLLDVLKRNQGIPVSFEGAYETRDPHNALADFNPCRVVKIEARLIEADDNVCSATKNRGGWMYDADQGGGIERDMGVHLHNPIVIAGYRHKKHTEVMLGAPTGRPGEYLRFGSKPVQNMPTGEIYARVTGIMSIENGNQDIEVITEAAKEGKIGDAMIRMTDDRGYVLHWTLSPQNIVRLYDKEKKELASISTQADCYALTYAEMAAFFGQKRPSPVALYAYEHFHVVRMMEEALAIAKEQEVSEGTILRQLALEEKNTVIAPEPTISL